MKIRLYAIRDKKAGVYNTPVPFDNDAVAIRAFGDLIERDKNNIISVHPSDFSLCLVGEFDRETGDICPLDTVVVADGDQFIKE